MIQSAWCLSFLALSLLLAVHVFHYDAVAFDSLDPTGNITIKWDVMQWTGDGYQATVTLYNWQLYRHIDSPGWVLGWTWAKKEIIWNMVGAQATDQGDCSKVTGGTIPHSCAPSPQIVDLLPGVPYSQQTANCCRGGVLSAFAQDPSNSVALFIIIVGRSGNTNTSVVLPKNFTLAGPGPGYTCSAATKVPKTRFLSPDRRRTTLALMTWNLTCIYSQTQAQKAPSCCVSFSAFYNSTIVPCPKCACDCPTNGTNVALADTTNQLCIDRNDPHPVLPTSKNTGIVAPDMLYCTQDMCPVKIHWHVKVNYQEYWRVKLTITNRDLSRNFSLWNMVAQHPNFGNFTEAFSFSYKPLNPYGPSSNNSALFWGVKYYNDMLMQGGPDGNVQSEILFRKDSLFTLASGWAFPHRILFNGDECVLPEPDQYPSLPSGTIVPRVGILVLLVVVIFALAALL
ncbi:unnamed protein product [Sphagnum troendelagicum]|uniref:COBRA-like protein n=1 Tax=Sphagnum troendelagicum TaxID=128251 RepID=A0ABP0TSS7_9BRYO